tara:strand:- start:35 stop:304 length:270 start_codon:yes stop_codon:yes gene_type:complete
MAEQAFNIEMGSVAVHTTENRGHSAEEITEMALDKIIHVGDNAPQPIRDQAMAYRSELRTIVLFYIRQAMLSERVTIRAEIAAEMKENE